MKKIILLLPVLLILSSCGGQDGECEAVDGLCGSEDHRIFVTSSSFDGNLGGLSGADSLCATAANNAGLEKTYKALLSDSGDDASDRINITGSVYIFTSDEDKDLVASDVTDLWGTDSQDLLTNVDIDEDYNSAAGALVWTGTDSDGSGAADNCSDWSTNAGGTDGWYGDVDELNDSWVESNTSGCNNSYRLYCISI